MNAIRNFWDWVTLADYEAAKEQSTVDVVSRFARGNVSIQNGQIIDEDDLREIATLGDKALANLDGLRTRG